MQIRKICVTIRERAVAEICRNAFGEVYRRGRAMHEGHRKRMIERLEQNGESLQEHELLEILLYNAIPRKNTNEIAHNLLEAFGGIDRLFEADVKHLTAVDGVGKATAAYIKTISLCYERVQFGKMKRVNFFTVDAVMNYLKNRYLGLSVEVIDLFCIDSRGYVKFYKRFTSYSAEKVDVKATELSSVVINQDPQAVVIAHNHLGADCTPSRSDDSFTAELYALCSMHGIKLQDHVIVSKNGYYSYHLAGKMQEISAKYSRKNLFEK